MIYQPGDEITWIDKTGVFGGKIGDLYKGIVTERVPPWPNGEYSYHVTREEAPGIDYHVPENLIVKEDYNTAWDRAMRGI